MQGIAALQDIQGRGGALAAAAAAAPRPQPGGSGFCVAEPPFPAARTPAGAVAPAALLGLLAVQEAEGAAARDRDARRRGKQMLDELARLQRALLTGRADRDGLRALAALAAESGDAADPALATLVRAVAVRARVELARLGAAATR